MQKIRYACLEDLNNYFKKRDLLGGLTELEKTKLRHNIGIPESINENQVIYITYSMLYELLLRESLSPGTIYIITDFQSIYSSNVLNNLGQYISWGHINSENPSRILSIAVTAITPSIVNKRIVILRDDAKNWVVEYDITRETLEDGITTKGKITYLKDTNGNSAYYDFKNLKFRRTREELSNSNLQINTFLDFYTYSRIELGDVIENSSNNTVKNNTLGKGCINNIFIGDTYNNIFYEDCRLNTFLRGSHDCTFEWNSVNNLFNENVCYLRGSVYNKFTNIGDTLISSSITKTINKVNDLTLIVYIDPILNTYKIIPWENMLT